MLLRSRRAGTPLALFLAASLALSACSGGGGGGGGEGSGDGDSTPAVEETPYLDVPEGVELTAQGSELEVGESATVAYQPRQNAVGALDITVTALERATFSLFEGWDLKEDVRKTSPYFVRATVENVGDTDLGGRPVPLYIVDGENRLIESSIFMGNFQPCSGSMFPKRFRTGDRTRACLVYLAPDKGDLTAVSFRPDQEFDGITWTGELAKADSGTKKADDRKKSTKKRKKNQGGGG